MFTDRCNIVPLHERRYISLSGRTSSHFSHPLLPVSPSIFFVLARSNVKSKYEGYRDVSGAELWPILHGFTPVTIVARYIQGKVSFFSASMLWEFVSFNLTHGASSVLEHLLAPAITFCSSVFQLPMELFHPRSVSTRFTTHASLNNIDLSRRIGAFYSFQLVFTPVLPRLSELSTFFFFLTFCFPRYYFILYTILNSREMRLNIEYRVRTIGA